jgi:hypothetical protein
MKARIAEVLTPEGFPAFAIFAYDGDKPVAALKWIDAHDHKPIWINHIAWGWSTLNRAEAERALMIVTAPTASVE